MTIQIQILLSVTTNTKDPQIVFQGKSVPIKNPITLESNNLNDIAFIVNGIENNSSSISLKKILVNNIEANIFHNTSFTMENNKYVENKTLTSIQHINFNGTFKLQIDENYLEPLRSQHWHITNKNDYVFNYIFTEDIFDLAYRPRNHAKIISNSICAIGDSWTFGYGLSNPDTWPSLLQEKLNRPVLNLAVPGAGIDLIYHNVKKLVRDFSFEKIIVNLPIMERRLIRCKLHGNKFYQVPNAFEPASDDNTWLYANFANVKAQRNKIQNKIFNDVNCNYSKKIINKFCKFVTDNNVPCFFTSRDQQTYDYISTQPDIKILPMYPKLDDFPERAGSGYHPAKAHNISFVESIMKYL
jgi:hypothetical protein